MTVDNMPSANTTPARPSELIEKLAREHRRVTFSGRADGATVGLTDDGLLRLVQLAAEECAKVCEETVCGTVHNATVWGHPAATAIRAKFGITK